MLPTRRVVFFAAVVGLGTAAGCLKYPDDPEGATLRVGIPSGWNRVGGVVQSYALGTDPTIVHGGKLALRIVGTDTNPQRFAGVAQFLKVDDYRGKRVRLSGWVRQSNIVGSAGLWMRVDGPGVTLGFDNFATRPLVGTSDWHQVEVILDVPANALGISFGALMSARGELLVDDMAFEIIAATGPTTNLLDEPTPVTIDSATTAASYANVPRVPSNLGFESP